MIYHSLNLMIIYFTMNSIAYLFKSLTVGLANMTESYYLNSFLIAFGLINAIKLSLYLL